MQLKYKFEKDINKTAASQAMDTMAKEMQSIYDKSHDAELPDFEEALHNVITWDDFITA